MTNAYRSADHPIVTTRLMQVVVTQERFSSVGASLASVSQARMARIIASGVGILGVAVMVALALAIGANVPELGLGAPVLTYALAASCGAAVAAYAVARVVLRVAFAFRAPAVREELGLRAMLTGTLAADLALLDAHDPLLATDRRLGRLETWSAALPLVALALLTPLALHLVVALVFVVDKAKDFDWWIQVSLVIVGHAHLVLVGMSVRYARKMRRASMEELQAMSVHREWFTAWSVTILASLVPGILALGVPSAISAATAILFVPPMFIGMRRRILDERAQLAQAYATAGVAPAST